MIRPPTFVKVGGAGDVSDAVFSVIEASPCLGDRRSRDKLFDKPLVGCDDRSQLYSRLRIYMTTTDFEAANLQETVSLKARSSARSEAEAE